MEKFAIFGMSGAFLIALYKAAFAYSPTVNDIVSFLSTALNNHLQMALLQCSWTLRCSVKIVCQR